MTCFEIAIKMLQEQIAALGVERVELTRVESQARELIEYVEDGDYDISLTTTKTA